LAVIANCDVHGNISARLTKLPDRYDPSRALPFKNGNCPTSSESL